jgi:hypothetical protein
MWVDMTRKMGEMMPLIIRTFALALALAAAAALGAASSPIAQERPDVATLRQQFTGTYRLISWIAYDENGGERRQNYTVGQISYDAVGRMSAHLMAPGRPTAGRGATDADRVAASAGYIGYFGRYEVDPVRGVVTHHVEGAYGQNMVGQAMPRWYEFSPDGQTLYLMTRTGDRVTGRLRWDRYR